MRLRALALILVVLITSPVSACSSPGSGRVAPPPTKAITATRADRDAFCFETGTASAMLRQSISSTSGLTAAIPKVLMLLKQAESVAPPAIRSELPALEAEYRRMATMTPQQQVAEVLRWGSLPAAKRYNEAAGEMCASLSTASVTTGQP